MGKTTKRKKKVLRKSSRRSQQFSHGDLIILGFTGSLGSGCTYLSGGLQKYLHDARYFSLSQIIKDQLIKEGVKKPTINQLQDRGNDLRKRIGVSALTGLCIKAIVENGKENAFSDDTVVLIDGIRNNGEIRSLRAFPNFYLISVHAQQDIRKNRLVGKGNKFKFHAEKDFTIADMRDKEEDFEYGQQVNKCNYLSDIIINNETKITKDTETEKQFFQKIERDYIDRMRKIKKGENVIDHPPSIDETLMTIAYCASKRSSCDKRKVGAVVACITEIEDLKEQVKRPEDNIKFQVISTGYNEVPIGTEPCRLSEVDKCQRDFLKEDFSRKFDCCPKCGTKIPTKVKGEYNSFLKYHCSKCKTNILSRYLPGSSATVGKLLDMCRALHAEEIALLGLEGISKAGRKNKTELVLYTTTYPCNLCANKIVASGIDRVVYAEPYTMEESQKILGLGKVEVVKFEGVKSTAYFRLYS